MPAKRTSRNGSPRTSTRFGRGERHQVELGRENRDRRDEHGRPDPRCNLEWPIRVFPLIPWRNGRQDIPMLDHFSVLDPKQIVERSWPGGEISLRQHKYKVALGHETTRGEMQLSSFLCHAYNSIPQPGNSIADFRGMLRIAIAVNKLLDAIEAQ